MSNRYSRFKVSFDSDSNRELVVMIAKSISTLRAKRGYNPPEIVERTA